MKRILFIAFITALVGSMFTSCENGDWDFPDFEYSTVYFAYQSPVRTVVLGEDPAWDNSFDKQHQVQIMATMGGVYANNSNVEIGIRVDPTLLEDMIFAKAEETDPDVPVLLMPDNYYSLSSDKITIPKGSVIGGVTVQLTEAFFNDPLALTGNYVIPVVMTSVTGVDSILSGKPLVENPKRGRGSDWDVQPKDYILYAVKYINEYDANYLRRGTDVVTVDGGEPTTVTREAAYVEKNEVITSISTISRNVIAWDHVSRTKVVGGTAYNCTLILTFDDEGKCVISTETPGVTASGTGEFILKGDKEGDKDRDALYLDYTINYGDAQFETSDILSVLDRGIKPEWFTAVVNE